MKNTMNLQEVHENEYCKETRNEFQTFCAPKYPAISISLKLFVLWAASHCCSISLKDSWCHAETSGVLGARPGGGRLVCFTPRSPRSLPV